MYLETRELKRKWTIIPSELFGEWGFLFLTLTTLDFMDFQVMILREGTLTARDTYTNT